MPDPTAVPASERVPPAVGASAEQMQTVLDGLPGMVGYWDLDLRNVFANKAYVEYFGLRPEQIVGRHLREVLGPEVYEANLPFALRALAGQAQLFDRTLVDRDQQVRHTQASYVPDVVDGVVRGFCVLVTDVTRRVEAEQRLARSAEQYRALASSLPGGFVLLFDTDLRFTIADGPELPAFGYTSADLEGRRVREVFSPEQTADVVPRYLAALAGAEVTWERRVGGRTFALRAGPVRSDDGVVHAAMVVASDVTTARRTQASLRSLREVATAVARGEAPAQVSRLIATSLNEIFEVELAAVIRFTGPDTGEIVAITPRQPASVPTVLHLDHPDALATAQVARTGAPALVAYRPGADPVAGGLRAEGLLSGASAPIQHGGVTWGAISVSTTDPTRLNLETLDELAAFAELAELAIGNFATWTDLAAQAHTDPLTGLANRRAFDVALQRSVARSTRDGEPFSLVMIDVDRFKLINDTYGHAVGDDVLAAVAQALSSVVRADEVLARVGGEEFAWLLPRTPVGAAAVAAERARRTVSALELEGVGPVAVSMGVCCSTDVASAAEVRSGADRALYEAKRLGRDRVHVHGPPAP